MRTAGFHLEFTCVDHHIVRAPPRPPFGPPAPRVWLPGKLEHLLFTPVRQSWPKSRRKSERGYSSLSKETSMPFSNPAFWPTAFCACAAPSAPMRRWSRFSYPAPLLCDSCYLLDHEN